MWQGYSAPCGEVTKGVAMLLSPPVARLPNLWQNYLWRGYLVARLPVIDVKEEKIALNPSIIEIAEKWSKHAQ